MVGHLVIIAWSSHSLRLVILWSCLGHLLVMLRLFGYSFGVIVWSSLGHPLVIFWSFGNSWGVIFWSSFGNILVILRYLWNSLGVIFWLSFARVSPVVSGGALLTQARPRLATVPPQGHRAPQNSQMGLLEGAWAFPEASEAPLASPVVFGGELPGSFLAGG